MDSIPSDYFKKARTGPCANGGWLDLEKGTYRYREGRTKTGGEERGGHSAPSTQFFHQSLEKKEDNFGQAAKGGSTPFWGLHRKFLIALRMGGVPICLHTAWEHLPVGEKKKKGEK